MPEQEQNAAYEAPATLPETIEINGVIYRREGDWVDRRIASIKDYQSIAFRTGLTLQQVLWFDRCDGLFPA